MDDRDGLVNAKRLKSATGAPIRPTPTAILPRYQPPNGARVSPSNTPVTAPSSSASLSRASPSANPSLKLTVKAAPSKLRQATSGSQSDHPTNPYADDVSSSSVTPAPAPPPRGVRSTRNPRTVVEPDSDDDEDMDDEDADAEVDEEALGGDDEDDDEEEEEEEEEDIDIDADDADAEGDVEDIADELSAQHPPPPVISTQLNSRGRPNVMVTAPFEGPLKSVEAKEMGAEDEELSDIESGDEADPLREDGDEEDEDEDGDDDDDDIEMGDDSDDIDGSRSATPDLSKLTRRQRGVFEEHDSSLMALSNEAQKKKHLTAEEHAMRRAEMARRRKNLSEKRNEEEKIDTINKLLKKPAPKRRTRAEIIAAQQAELLGTPGADGEEREYVKPEPVFVRWVSTSNGSRIGVPSEWLEAPVGDLFSLSGGDNGRRSAESARAMIEEVA